MKKLLKKLCAEPCIYWIREISSNSKQAVRFFSQALVDFLKSAKLSQNSLWLFESEFGLIPGRESIVELKLITNAEIARILGRIPFKNGLYKTEEVIELAQGNPGRAIRLCQVQTEEESTHSRDTFNWFLNRLNKYQRDLLSVMCILSSTIPFEITTDIVIDCVRFIFPLPTNSEMRFSVIYLIEELERVQLAKIVRFNRATFNALLDDFIPKQTDLIFISRINPDPY